MPENVFVRGESDSNFEAMTKQQVLTAIVEAVESGTIGDIDTGFVTTIKELNKGQGLKFWVGTSAEYNALEEKENNVLYIKTDDTSPADISAAIEALQSDVDALKQSAADSGWRAITVTSPWSNVGAGVDLRCRKVGQVAYIRGRVQHASNAAESKLVGIVPEGFRPLGAGAYGTCYTYDGYMFSPCIVQTSGVIQVNQLINSTDLTIQSFVGKTIMFDLSYLTDE